MKSRDIVLEVKRKKNFASLSQIYYYLLLLLLFTGNAYPSKPKIDGVGSAKYYEKIYIKYISSLQNCE